MRRPSSASGSSASGPASGVGEVLILTQNSTKLLFAFVLLVVFVAAIVGYSIWRTAASVSTTRAAEQAVATPANIIQSRDPNRASWRALLNPPGLNPPQAPGSDGGATVRSDTLKEIQQRTRDDGAVRKITVDGKPVAPQLVQEAIFNNHNFATRANYEFPQFEKHGSHDPTQQRPKSMFGPLTAPLAAGGFGMDLNGKIIQ